MCRGCRFWCMLLLTALVARKGVVAIRIRLASSAFITSLHRQTLTIPQRKTSFMLQNTLSNSNTMSTTTTTTIPTGSTTVATSTIATTVVTAKIVSPSQLEECGERLRQGDLVAFPTETVYGLGCHALDPVAVQKVFDAKERPLTDPLIVHVNHAVDALKLWQNHSDPALIALTTTFWPGPLTIVAKAAPTVPQILMANTGFVACRSPSHTIARQLIDCAQVPIAAPSANKFGHVSPTKSSHVWDDLHSENVWIIDAPEGCHVGVESTVAKVSDNGHVTVLRQGAVSVEQIAACLHHAGLTNVVERNTERAVHEHVATVAPGQTIRHYSPNIPSFMIASAMCTLPLSEEDQSALKTTIIIDFGGVLQTWNQFALAYRDLSCTGDSAVAARHVFDALRWAERIEGGSRIVFPDLPPTTGTDALTLALKDRLTRAASGVVIDALQ